MSELRGDKKQSVRDAELMFNTNFLHEESEYVEAVLGMAPCGKRT